MRAEAFQPFDCIVRRLGLNGQSCPQFVPKVVSPNLAGVATQEGPMLRSESFRFSVNASGKNGNFTKRERGDAVLSDQQVILAPRTAIEVSNVPRGPRCR